MYKNLEKVYCDKFEDIDQKSAMENKLYILQYPYMGIYNKWIYNKFTDQLEPLASLGDLFDYKHVPGKLDKTDETHDYITVKNENRTLADGLDPRLTDILKQHFLIDTSVLDVIIDNLVENQGVEIEISGTSDPDDDTCIDVGDITEFDELRFVWSSNDFSIPRSINYFDVKNGEPISFVFSNIGDTPASKGLVTGEIGQTLADVKGDYNNAQVCFTNSQLFRFQNDLGTGDNGSFNRTDSNGTTIQPGGHYSLGTVWFPYSTFGGGWIRINKITGVTYGSKSVIKSLSMIMKRLQANQYTTFKDYNRMLKYTISSNSKYQSELLKYLERFKEDFTEQDELDGKSKNRYEKLIKYRMKLEGND